MNKSRSFFKRMVIRILNEYRVTCAKITKIFNRLIILIDHRSEIYLATFLRCVLIMIIVVITSTIGYGLYIKFEYGRLYKNLEDSLDQFDAIEINFEEEFTKADKISQRVADMMNKKAFSEDAMTIQVALKEEYEVRSLMKRVRPVIRNVMSRIMKKYGWILTLW